MNNSILKVATLLLFCGLISGFVAFRSGYLTKASLTKHSSRDTIPNNERSQIAPIMPSSKVLIMNDHFLIDSVKPIVVDSAFLAVQLCLEIS